MPLYGCENNSILVERCLRYNAYNLLGIFLYHRRLENLTLTNVKIGARP